MSSKNWNEEATKLLDVPLLEEDKIDEPPEKTKDVDDQEIISQQLKKNKKPEQESIKKTRQKAKAIESKKI